MTREKRSDLTCDTIRDLFTEALYGELDTGAKQEFDRHIAACDTCRKEFGELKQTLSLMNERTRVELTEEEWKEFGKRLDEKLADENPAAESLAAESLTAETGAAIGGDPEAGSDRPAEYAESTGDTPRSRPNIIRWRSFLKPAWGYGIAAVFILAIGFYIGRTFFNGNGSNGPAGSTDGPSFTQGQTQTPAQDQGVTPGQSNTDTPGQAATGIPDHPGIGTSGQTGTTTPDRSQGNFAANAPSISGEAATKDALDYLERSRNLLIGLSNLDDTQSESVDLTRPREISRALYNKGNTLTVALARPSQQQLRQLVQHLQIILLQLSNTGVGDGRPAVELVRQGMSSQSILLKINLEAIRATLSERVADADEEDGSAL